MAGTARKWYHSPWALVFGLALVGPFALPLLWSNPRYRPLTKIVVTVLVLAVTVLVLYALILLVMHLVEQFRELVGMYP